MAHFQQLEFVKTFSDFFVKDKKISVLELGSFNYNGSVRQFFPNSIYTGVDVIEGPDVDLIYDGKNFNFNDNSFDLCISCECFEHNPYWKENFINLIKFTKPNGFILITCATLGRPEHGTNRTDLKSSPGSMQKWDYYKNISRKDFEEINLKQYFSTYSFWENKISRDLYFLGNKIGDKNQIKYLTEFSDKLIYKNSIITKHDQQIKKTMINIFKYLLQNYLSKILSDKFFRNLWIFLKKF
jgi:SAM-dependent methyltransferase